MATWPAELVHTVTPADCGEGGGIDERALIVLFQQARDRWFHALPIDPDDRPPVRLYDLRLKVLRRVGVGDELLVRAQVDAIAARTIRMRYLVFDARTDAFAAEGSSLLVPLGDRGLDRDVPAALRAAAEALEGRPFSDVD